MRPNYYFASTTQPNTQNNTLRYGRVGQPGPNTLLTHVKNSTVTVILRTRQSPKPEKNNYWKNRDRVTPTYAMASLWGYKAKQIK